MRKIKFRGKHIHVLPQNEHLNGTWVYGYLCDENYINSPELEGEFVIDPKTLGQYTGLKDKNGKEIYEGDIVKICTFGFNSEVFITEVVYDKCAFRLKNGRNMFYYGQTDFSKMDDTVVIGNIFDNPKLLRGDTN